MPRKRSLDPPPADPIKAAVRALRIATDETEDDWPDDLRDLKPAQATTADRHTAPDQARSARRRGKPTT